jgi:hypothetical protein
LSRQFRLFLYKRLLFFYRDVKRFLYKVSCFRCKLVGFFFYAGKVFQEDGQLLDRDDNYKKECDNQDQGTHGTGDRPVDAFAIELSANRCHQHGEHCTEEQRNQDHFSIIEHHGEKNTE